MTHGQEDRSCGSEISPHARAVIQPEPKFSGSGFGEVLDYSRASQVGTWSILSFSGYLLHKII